MQSIEQIKEILNLIDLPDITNLATEKQNEDYEGAVFSINQTTYRSRLTKLTPKKNGYFVAFWEKDSNNTNQAFSYAESPDFLILSIIDENKKGQFVFPKEVLHKQKILRSESQKGKMAIRVYPSWETDLNPTATKTQKWQLPHFVDLSEDIDVVKLTKLYKKG
ncbi:MepB family protein [Vagococcus hydrophili]|uniref:MepB family protein n=1 Tax=Vagococcus hydrophili TaxID=2714947 RepID=A0A6G8AT09_9ENTE|nr:MepB family protein [Vagococcus hydrophili]QIL48127.1 MepB family protein [Vagococcus hydrophili]